MDERKDYFTAEEHAKHPSKCPHTGLPFFMMIKDSSGDWVPTYGGPFDSFTIPVKNDNDAYWTRERYDHDAGWWSDSECIDVDGVDEED